MILEGREAIGGTWDLFRYPGIRSDSDMYTLGYSFKPWTEAKAIADGPSILKYVRDTARDFGIDKHIRYGHQVKAASWSSEDARWTVEAVQGGKVVKITANFLFLCGGYYSYEGGYTPDFPGVEAFKGRLVHPQKWPEDLDYAGKNVVVIGSGATAVTLVPAMAKTAARVTMLQRSPTYVVSRPAEDAMANKLRKWLPAKLAYSIIRWRNVLVRHVLLPRRADQARAGEAEHHRHGAPAASAPTTTSPSISRRPTTPGTSGSAWCPTPTSSRRSGRTRPRWSPTISQPSRRPASG